MEVTKDDDRARPVPGAPADVVELHFVTETAALGGLVRLDVRGAAGATRLLVAVVRSGEPNVVVVDHELPVPRHSFELRAPGVWVELGCETPLDHWTVGLEAFGLVLDRGEVASPVSRGERVPVGLDLDLDTTAPPARTGDGFHLPVRVHGDVLVADARYGIDTQGTRFRRWDGRRPLVPPRPADETPGGSLAVSWPEEDGPPAEERWAWYGGSAPGWAALDAQSA